MSIRKSAAELELPTKGRRHALLQDRSVLGIGFRKPGSSFRLQGSAFVVHVSETSIFLATAAHVILDILFTLGDPALDGVAVGFSGGPIQRQDRSGVQYQLRWRHWRLDAIHNKAD